MSEQKHSPLPWESEGRRSIFDAKGMFVCLVDAASTERSEEDIEIAARIVKCVNSHDELLAIVRELVESGILCYVDDDYEDLSSGRPGIKVTAEGLGLLFHARKALEKAGEPA